ncbi:MAG: YraN family protein [Methylococcaceae bacterium]
MNDYLKPKSKAAHLLRGEQAEQLACDFLISQGLTLIARNFRCVYGELDLIMNDSETLVIVEVRYRKNAKFGSALESVNYSKQAKISAATEFYLNTLSSDMPRMRFDVVGILGDGDLQWVKNAF